MASQSNETDILDAVAPETVHLHSDIKLNTGGRKIFLSGNDVRLLLLLLLKCSTFILTYSSYFLVLRPMTLEEIWVTQN